MEKIYTTSPNQKIIVHHTKFDAYGDKEQMFFTIGYNNISQAMKALSHKALKLYLFLNKDIDGHEYPLSPVLVERFTGMKEDTYQKAVKELIEHGYLVRSARQKNIFDFYVTPQRVNTDKAEQPKPETSAAVVMGTDLQKAEEKPVDTQECSQKKRAINKALDVVSRRIHGIEYNGWKQLPRSQVEDELKELGYNAFTDEYIRGQLDNNTLLISMPDQTTFGEDDKLPF